ncbi:helix-turn-helix domain-containing protein [Pseudomonas coronafaciens]|uniref:helix-turn-helix domain-containing protein n=1 Tax=Pseudomonas coronafaciens TaxID=53409 RepID=UPI0006D5CF63|nr:helix-turn-helix domain-containing protein [Pseudomonas coronafaciens]
MSLRSAYASALQHLRKRRESSQQALGQAADRSYISRLESGTRSVTLDVSQNIAKALGVDPLTLLVLAYAADRGQTPQQVLDHLLVDLTATGLLGSEIPSLPSRERHPVAAAAEELRARIKELMAEGLSQSDVARRLGVARQTVSNHLKKIE